MKDFYLGGGAYTEDKEQGLNHLNNFPPIKYNVNLLLGLIDMLTDSKLASPLHQVTIIDPGTGES